LACDAQKLMSNPSSTRALTGSTVVLIDDDTSVLSALARLIRSAGYDVKTFTKASVLLAADLPSSDACLVVDVNLPEMNGAELCERLVHSGHALPVIFITGRRDPATQALTRRVPAIAVLFKPFNEDLLFPAISRALQAASGSDSP
jgi:FixJ family two-component response regulator